MQNEQPPPNNLGCIKGLAITQLVIGIVSFIISIVVLASAGFFMNSGSGTWTGVWIVVTGIIGVLYAVQWKAALNGVYLAFSIISSVLAGLTLVFYALFSVWYTFFFESYRNLGIGYHIILVLLMIVELVISIIASCFSCKGVCNNNNNNQAGVILQPVVYQQHQQPYAGQYPPDKQGYAPVYTTGQPGYAPGYNGQPGNPPVYTTGPPGNPQAYTTGPPGYIGQPEPAPALHA